MHVYFLVVCDCIACELVNKYINTFNHQTFAIADDIDSKLLKTQLDSQISKQGVVTRLHWPGLAGQGSDRAVISLNATQH